MVFENLLNPVFAPLLTLPSWLSILIISFIITMITTLAYKYLTDQNKMKELKAEMKTYQKKIKTLTKENPDKAMKVQQEMMGKNMELMKHSFKPMLYTLIPLLIIFGWLNAHMAFHPLYPGESFDVTLTFEKGTTGDVTFKSVPELMIHKDNQATQPIKDSQVTWTLLADAGGEHQLIFEYKGKSYTKEILISDETGHYAAPLERIKQEPFKQIEIGNEKIRPLAGAPLVGNWGWLGIYIVFSIIMSIGIRKLLKIA